MRRKLLTLCAVLALSGLSDAGVPWRSQPCFAQGAAAGRVGSLSPDEQRRAARGRAAAQKAAGEPEATKPIAAKSIAAKPEAAKLDAGKPQAPAAVREAAARPAAARRRRPSPRVATRVVRTASPDDRRGRRRLRFGRSEQVRVGDYVPAESALRPIPRGMRRRFSRDAYRVAEPREPQFFFAPAYAQPVYAQPRFFPPAYARPYPGYPDFFGR